PANPARGVPLAQRAAGIEERLRRLAGITDQITPAVLAAWEAALAAPAATTRTWLHGDLHPRNVLVDAGRISGIIDWGDLTAGDSATDLAAIWMLFEDPAERAAAWEAYGEAAPALQARAAGWAVILGALLLDTGLVDHPAHARIGERTLRRLGG
ncbi:MAG TPA: phosphotransferase, partial [Herpetosiphonaceae bacterium]